jgi:hypothetical protein
MKTAREAAARLGPIGVWSFELERMTAADEGHIGAGGGLEQLRVAISRRLPVAGRQVQVGAEPIPAGL